jgi:hypothetical protein
MLEARIKDNEFSYSRLVEQITTTSYSDHRPEFKFIKAGDYNGEDNEIYCVTYNNKIVINTDHIDTILKRIKDIKLYDQIKGNLNNLNIPNAQRSNTYTEEFYCNENVYGSFNLIMIYGFLIFDAHNENDEN